MAISTSELKAGDVLYDVHREKMGNTTCSRLGCWPVYVREVADDGSWASCSWNGNAPQKHRRVLPGTWRRWPPEWLPGTHDDMCEICGAYRREGHHEECEHPTVIRRRAAEAKRADRERARAERERKQAEFERLRAEKLAIAETRVTSARPVLHYRETLRGLAWVTTERGKVVMLPERYYDTLPSAAVAAREAGISLGFRSSMPRVVWPIAGIGGHS